MTLMAHVTNKLYKVFAVAILVTIHPELDSIFDYHS